MLVTKSAEYGGTAHPCDWWRCVDVDDDGVTYWASMEGDYGAGGMTGAYWVPALAVPDLRDPATRGCVMQLVRDAWNDHHIYVRKLDVLTPGEAWFVCDGNGAMVNSACYMSGQSAGGALVAALEAAQ
jgi:hypothetical protein